MKASQETGPMHNGYVSRGEVRPVAEAPVFFLEKLFPSDHKSSIHIRQSI